MPHLQLDMNNLDNVPVEDGPDFGDYLDERANESRGQALNPRDNSDDEEDNKQRKGVGAAGAGG